MEMRLYSIRDIKSENGFMIPFAESNDDAAKRYFASIVQFGQNIISQFPADFDLYYVGKFDSKTGIITSIEPNKFICCGTDVRSVRVNEE